MTKRGRGLLEADVKQITDAYVMGEFTPPDGKPLTAYRIATAIKERDGLDELPTVGGVVYVLERWERIGFATFTRPPFAFDDYTEEGRTVGLSALGQRDKEARKAQRKAVRAAEAEATTEQPEKAEVMPTTGEADDSARAWAPASVVGREVEDDPAGADAVAADDEVGPFDAPTNEQLDADENDGIDGLGQPYDTQIPSERVEA